MSFATLYDSAWQHPGLAWLGTLPILAWAVTQRVPESKHPARAPDAQTSQLARARLRLLWVLQALIALDALCTGGLSPLPSPSPWATAAAVFFVIAGDARFFFLLQDPSLSATGMGARLLRALLLSAVLSLAAYVGQQVFPAQLPSSRHLFLTYELMLLVTTLVLAAWFARRAPDPAVRCQRRLTGFVALQYGLWALADVVILSAASWSDLGFALRLVPNALYYVAFVPFAVRFGTASRVEAAAPSQPRQAS